MNINARMSSNNDEHQTVDDSYRPTVMPHPQPARQLQGTPRPTVTHMRIALGELESFWAHI